MLTKLMALLSRQERNQIFFLLGLILLSACLEALGIASVMPFMAVLANPEVLQTNHFLARGVDLAASLGIVGNELILLFMGAIFFVLLVFSIGVKCISTYFQLRVALMLEFSIGKRLVERYLDQTYEWFLNRNSADLGKTVLSEVNTVVYVAIYPMIRIIAHGILTFLILVLLILADPAIALFSGVVIGACYVLIFLKIRRVLSRYGEERFTTNKKRFSVLSEAFGSIKDVKLNSLENVYSNLFAGPALKYAQRETQGQVLGQLPRFILEAVAFGGILAVTLYLMTSGDLFADVLPLLALYVFAGYRLLPAMQQVYQSGTELRFAKTTVAALHEEYTGLKVAEHPIKPDPIVLRESIKLIDVTYRYPKARTNSINGLSLTLPAQSVVGIAGPTGSGKTTLVDIVLGLISPHEGNVVVDGTVISDTNRKSWQRLVGYVPQNIYLADDSILANIAFGVPLAEICQESVIKAARAANLHDFIEEELAEKYFTKVGERGVRLSGGQRQRIGIARALYKAPEVLILDEGTSALDGFTEKMVMEAIGALAQTMTIILVAHRLNTLRKCQAIFLLEGGSLVEQGSFAELKYSSKRFKAMLAGDNVD